jgi:hypothetical protein
VEAAQAKAYRRDLPELLSTCTGTTVC